MRVVKNQRFCERYASAVRSRYRREGGPAEEALIVNISSGGCRLEAPHPPRHGARIWIELPGLGAFEARVIWTRGDDAGCKFVQLLHPAAVDRLLGRRLPRMARPERARARSGW